MEWTIVAIAQMLLITIVVGVALGLRIRGINKQNAQLRGQLVDTQERLTLAENANLDAQATQIEEQNQEASVSMAMLQSWSEERINASGEENPFTPAYKVVLAHALQDNENVADDLIAALSEANLIQQGVADDAKSEDICALLQQFTNDSRELMSCIQTLEEENAALRQALDAGESLPTTVAQSTSSENEELQHEDNVDRPDDTEVAANPKESDQGDTPTAASELGDAQQADTQQN